MNDCVGKPKEGRNEYVEIDEAIAVRLSPLREYLEEEGVLVRALPDMAAGFGEPAEQGDVYFVLAQGKANTEDDGKFVDESWQLTLVILLPMRYAKAGVYDVFKRSRDLLIGYKPPYCTKAIGAPDWRFVRSEMHWAIEANFPFDVYLLDAIAVEDSPVIKSMVVISEGRTEVIK